MQHEIKAKVKAPSVAKRGKPSHANIEALNGGGFKTTLHHHSASPNASMYGDRPMPVEAAHKTYKQARKAVDDHFQQPISDDMGQGTQ